MKFVMKMVLLIGVFMQSILSVFALDIPMNIQVNEISETSVSLQWDTVEDALGYHVYFSEQPGFEIISSEKREYITEIPLVLENLSPETTYYFLVKSFDDVSNESDFSEEQSFTTSSSMVEEMDTEDEENTEFNSAVDFKLSNIEVLAQNQISLLFTSDLEDTSDAERIFKVVDKNDEFIQYTISESEIDTTNLRKVLVTFDELLPVDTEFKLTVISILDAQGRNLESGIESFENFIIENDKLNYVYEKESNSIVIINDDNTTTVVSGGDNTSDNGDNGGQYVDLEKEPSDVSGTTQDAGGQNSGNQGTGSEIGSTVAETSTGEVDGGYNSAAEVDGGKVDEKDIVIDVVGAGKDAEALPTTGPEHIFMLILALIFGAMTFVFKFRKS